VTTGLVSGNTGLPVWPGQPVNQAWMLMVTSTAVAQSAAAYLFTVWTGTTVATAGVSLYVLPAGKNLMVQNMEFAVTSSAVVGGTVQGILVQGAAASFVSASFRTQGLVMLVQAIVGANNVSVNNFGNSPIPQTGSMAVMLVASTAAVLNDLIIQGYLF
jgi:small ligand-binding sensory domain FIST